jgi:hypothetical protein
MRRCSCGSAVLGLVGALVVGLGAVGAVWAHEAPRRPDLALDRGRDVAPARSEFDPVWATRAAALGERCALPETRVDGIAPFVQPRAEPVSRSLTVPIGGAPVNPLGLAGAAIGLGLAWLTVGRLRVARPIAALTLSLVLAATLAETTVHAVHHLGDPRGASHCQVDGVAQHVVGHTAPAPPAAMLPRDPVAQAAVPSLESAPKPAAHPHADRGPPPA